MMGEARRCEVHGTALTSIGTCLLCERRSRKAPPPPGRGMLRLLVGVTSVALAAIVGYRVHLALGDHAAATSARPESVAVAVSAESRTASSPVATTATLADEVAPSPAEPRLDPNRIRAEHERLVAEAEREVQIDLYGEGWCPSCKKARGWLDANGVAYTYRDTSSDVNNHTMRALNPRGTIPTIDVEGQVVVGFNPAAMRAAVDAQPMLASRSARVRLRAVDN